MSEKPDRLHATTTGVLLGSKWVVWNTPTGPNDEIISQETADLLNRIFADADALRRDAEKWRSFAAAATELRRLYTEIERLKAANRELGDVVIDYKAGAQALSAENAILHADNERLREEVRVLRLYGNKDCTAMADEAMKKAALRREDV
jgi:FtsZ-binding cell division protein ZapB